MSVTVEQLQNFVGGEWVDAVEGGTMEVHEPGDRRDDRRGAGGNAGRRRPRRRGGEEGAAGVARDDTGRARRAPAEARRPDRRAHRRARASSSRATSASRSPYARDEMPVCSDNIRFFAGAARILEGRSAGEYMRGYTSWVRREPIGIVGQDRAVELPADDGGLEARAGARGRERPGAEAVRADTAVDAALRRARRRRDPGRAFSTSSPATATRSARRSSAIPMSAWSR